MRDIKVSIIVPVYNNEKYVKKCITSLLSQTEIDIEIIIIDDGSTDDSFKVCEELSKIDNRIVLIHQENAGVSSARNKGIQVAKGDYIGFVDSDDWIDKEMYSMLYYKAINESADIVMCDAEIIYMDGRRKEDTFYTINDMDSLSKELAPNTLVEIAGAVWRAIYRKKLIIENNVLFQENIKFSEDRIFNLQCISKMNKLLYIKKGFYKRLVHDSSAVHSFHEDYFERVLISYNEIKDTIKDDWGNDENIKSVYAKQFINGVFASFDNYCRSESNYNVKKSLKKIRSICNNPILQEDIKLIKNKTTNEKLLENKQVFLIYLIRKILCSLRK